MNPNLETVSLNRFKELLENLDVTEKGENLYLRIWPDGGSYIANDDGLMSNEFLSLEQLIEFLLQREQEIKNGLLTPLLR